MNMLKWHCKGKVYFLAYPFSLYWYLSSPVHLLFQLFFGEIFDKDILQM